MRQLTKQEYKFFIKANDEFLAQVTENAMPNKFKAGFIAGLDYQHAKLNAYAAYVAGKITLKELEEVING